MDQAVDFYHDRERKLLVYQPRNVDLICQHLPEAKKINGAYVALPATLRTVQVMRWLDMPVPNIMEADGYDWPIVKGLTPLAHQKLMAAFMVSHPRSFNLSDMGTMKTLSTLWAADYVMSKFPKGEARALIVTPLSILDRVWGAAIFANFLGRRTYKIIHGTPEKRERLLNEPADFYIINFDGVSIGAKARGGFAFSGVSANIRERPDIKLVIIDEMSAYRHSGTDRHRFARELLARRPYLWGLTGTPTPNGPQDAYGLAKLVNNAFGESERSYKMRTMYRFGQWTWKPKQGANTAARRLLTPAIRIDIKDVWDGPPSTIQQRSIELTAEQIRQMKRMKREMQISLHNGMAITADNEAAVRTKYLQISLGAIYDATHQAHAVDAEPRLKELINVCEETDRKIVVFVPLTSIVHLVHSHLIKEGYGAEIMHGETTRHERDTLLTRFRDDPRLRVLVCHPGVTAHGINEMVAADTVIWFGATDKPEHWLQGNARVNRPGQKYPTTIVQFVSNPVEREIYRRLEHNESLQGLLLTMVKDGKI